FCSGCCRLALCTRDFRRGGDCKRTAHSAGTGQGHGGDSPGAETGRMALCSHLRPRRREAGRFSYLVYGADWRSCLPSLERRGICILSVPAGFLGGGTCVAGESRSAPVLCCLPMGSAGVSLRAECVVTVQG